MKNTNVKVAIINYYACLRGEVKEVETFFETLHKLEINQPYEIEPKKDGFKFFLETENYLDIIRLHHPEIIEHDIEGMTNEEAESWEKFAYTVGVINRCSHATIQAIMVRRISENDFIFYAEKEINLGYSINSITDMHRFKENENPFTYFDFVKTYYNFEMLDDALLLESEEMAMLDNEGEIIITEKDTELLKSEGVRATETNFTDFLKKIDENGAVFMGYLNNHLYFC